MTSLRDLREARSAQVAEMRSLLSAAESQHRPLSSEEQARFDTLRQSIEAGEAQESRLAFLEEAERRAVGRPASDAAGRDMTRLEQRVSLLEVLRCQMEGRSLQGPELEYHQEAVRRTGRKAQGAFVPMDLFERRAASTTTTMAAAVPVDHRPDQYITPLRQALLARRLGVRVLSGLSGDVSIPRTATSMTTGWVAEDGALSASNLVPDAVTLTPAHCGGLTELSRQLIQQSSPDVEQLVREDFAAGLATALDKVILVGGGTSEPKGIVTTTGIQTSALATLSWANVHVLLQKLDLENAAAAGIVGSTKVKAKLAVTTKVTSDAGAGFLLDGDRVAGVPAYFTNNLAEKTGSPNTGRLIAGDFSQMLLGIWSELDILVNPFAETQYAKGNILVRAMMTVDVACRHPKAFVLADDITI